MVARYTSSVRGLKGGKKRDLGAEMEGYSKNGCGRKDKCSSCSGGRVGGKKVEVRREGRRGRAETS